MEAVVEVSIAVVDREISSPLYRILRNLLDQTYTFEHICDVVDAPFLDFECFCGQL